MKLQKLLCGLLLIPALVLTGCGKDDDTPPPTTEGGSGSGSGEGAGSGSGEGSGSGGETQLQYAAVEQSEVVTLLSQMSDQDKLNFNGYEFKYFMDASLLMDMMGGSDGGVDEDDNSEEDEYQVGDPIPWESFYKENSEYSVTMSGKIVEEDEQQTLKLTITAEGQTTDVYYKNNTLYSNSSEGKFKTTDVSMDDIYQMHEELESIDSDVAKLESYASAESGMAFEKAVDGTKVYYRMWGCPEVESSEPGVDFTMSGVPVEIHFVIENNQLVFYKFQTYMMMYLDMEVTASTTPIEFPADLDTYLEPEE